MAMRQKPPPQPLKGELGYTKVKKVKEVKVVFEEG